MATIIYIADDAQTRKFKGECRGIAGLKIGAFHGLGESDTYFVELGKSIRNSAGSIDAVVFDETSIASVVGANTLMSALIHYIKTGVASSVKLVVIDPEHVINNKGRSVLNQHDIRIIADIGELGPQFRLAFDERNRTDSEKGFTYDANYTRYDANDMENNPDDDYDDVEQSQTALADATDGQAGDDDMRIISRHTTNPFDDIENAIGDDDPFSGFDDAFGGSDDATEFSDYSDMSDGDGDAFDDGFDDDFRIIGATYSDDGKAFADDEQAVAGDDPFAGLYGTGDGNQGGATGGVDSIFDDLEQEPVDDVGLSTSLNGYSGDFDSRDIKRLLSFKEPSWDYSAINEALRNEGSGLFRGRKSGQKLGEVAPSSLANSVYIEEKQMREGAYSAPDETKIISLFSPAGGVGKTTIATMIGIQLNWYFNHDVMSGRTTSLTTRVLVLSLNEFDDIATKGIGYDSPIGQDDNKNVAELKKRIEECNGKPEWDDISQCFTASASNYVFYLPSLTLKEKLHDEIEITAEDYKMIIEVCSRFFGFIVLDMPDVMYDQKNGLVEFGLNNSDVVGVVIEPDTKNTVLLYYMLDGMKDNNNIINWDPDKSILIINKYATPDNPYLGYVKDPASYGQIKYESIVKAAANDFCYAQAMPLTEYRVTGNVLFTSDPEIKIAARDLTDKVLDVIDTNDEKNKKFVHKINQF